MAATPIFYVIYIERNAESTLEEVQEKMDKAVDWYRVEETLWILYTTSDAEKWFARLSPLAKGGGHVFICKLDPTDRQGWMNKSFWTWLKREKSET